jgi:hypothetical protein
MQEVPPGYPRVICFFVYRARQGDLPVSVLLDQFVDVGGVTRSIIGLNDQTNQFSGDFFETSAAIQVTATTLKSTGHGFRFVSSATTMVNLAQFGRETNGVFF